MSMPRIFRLSLLLLLASCGGQYDRPANSQPNMTAMPMLPPLRAHLDSIAAQPSMLRAAMPAHETEVRHVVEAMRADMAAAGMHSDAAYETLADSVVNGSAALGTARGAEFDRLVAQHVDQTRRLAAAYERKAAAM